MDANEQNSPLDPSMFTVNEQMFLLEQFLSDPFVEVYVTDEGYGLRFTADEGEMN